MKNISISGLETQLDSSAANVVKDFLYSPMISFILYSAIAVIIIGVCFRYYKAAIYSGMLTILILLFRLFSDQLFGGYGLFQAKVLIPIFAVTMCFKFASDYLKKKREESFEEEEYEPRHKRKTISSCERKGTGGLTRFGDSHEKRLGLEKSISANDFSTSADSAPKLNRSF